MHYFGKSTHPQVDHSSFHLIFMAITILFTLIGGSAYYFGVMYGWSACYGGASRKYIHAYVDLFVFGIR